MHQELIRIWTPLVLTAIGASLSYKAGILNIALEGFILLGALLMILPGSYVTSLPLMLVLILVTGFLTGSIYGFWVIESRSNIFITGLGMNLLPYGLVSTLSTLLYRGRGVIQLPWLTAIGNISRSLLFNGLLSLFFTGLSMLILFKTVFGVQLRAAGTRPELLQARGINPRLPKILAMGYSAALSALAGSLLVLRIGAFVPNMSANRGWIALVLVFAGKGNPLGIALAALVYAGAEYATNQLQGGPIIPDPLLLVFPYLITIIFLILSAFRDSARK